MSNLAIAVACTAVVAGALGYTAATLMAPEAKLEAPETSATAKKSGQNPTENSDAYLALKTDFDRLKKVHDDDKLRADKFELEASEAKTANKELALELDAARAKTNASTGPIIERSIEELGRTPFANLTPIEKARLKEEAIKVLANFRKAMEGGNKSEIVAEMTKLVGLGLSAKDEYFAAYNELSEVGNPWGNPENNKLEISKAEFGALMSLEVAHYSANDNGENVAEGARIHSAYMIAWDASVSVEERAKSYGNMLRTARSPYLVSASIENLQFMNGEPVGEMLIGIALDKTVAATTRRDSLVMVGNDYVKQITNEQVQQLLYSDEKEVQLAARYVAAIKLPPATGYLISSFVHGSQAQIGGLQVGDVLMTYDGVAVESLEKLSAAQENSKGMQVEITLYRAGEFVNLKLSGGPMGIMGRVIKSS